jgi:hypothetical protein
MRGGGEGQGKFWNTYLVHMLQHSYTFPAQYGTRENKVPVRKHSSHKRLCADGRPAEPLVEGTHRWAGGRVRVLQSGPSLARRLRLDRPRYGGHRGYWQVRTTLYSLPPSSTVLFSCSQCAIPIVRFFLFPSILLFTFI